MNIQNHTKNDLKLMFWETVNGDDVNALGSLIIKKNKIYDGEIPSDNFVIEVVDKMEESEKVISLKKGNKEPIEDRIKELEDQELNNDCATIIAIGEKDGN